MTIVYDSQTGNVERFIKKLRAKNSKLFCIPTEDYHIGLGEYHLITHTTKIGKIPPKTLDLLYNGDIQSTKNFVNLLSVSSSGNKNWGNNFAKAADSIQYTSFLFKKEGVPILLKFELSGTDDDVDTYLEKLENYGKQMDSSQ